MQDNNCYDEKSGCHQLSRVCGYNSCYDGHDGCGGDQRKDLYYFFCKFLEEMVDHKSKYDWNDYYLYNGKEHAEHVYVYLLACI